MPEVFQESKDELLLIQGCVIAARVKLDLATFINKLFRTESMMFSPYLRSFFMFSMGENSIPTKPASELDETRRCADIVHSIDQE